MNWAFRFFRAEKTLRLLKKSLYCFNIIELADQGALTFRENFHRRQSRKALTNLLQREDELNWQRIEENCRFINL